MTLSEADGKLFYQLWMPLLDFVNQKYHVNRKLKNIAKGKKLDPSEVAEVAHRLWEEPSLIDTYLEEYPEITGDSRELLLSWRNPIRGTFLVERHLKNGSILIAQNDEVYRSVGIISTWEEMLPYDLPIMIDATLIPFRDVIIPDGLVALYPVAIGSGMKRTLKDTYIDAKNRGAIHTSLQGDDANRQEKVVPFETPVVEINEVDEFDEMDFEEDAFDPEEASRCLELFKMDMMEAGLKPGTIRNHYGNIDFFVNEFLH